MTKNPAAVRKTNARKDLQKQIRALQNIEKALVKASTAIHENSQNLPNNDTFKQITDVFNKIGVGITITDAATQEVAHKLVNTLIGKK